MAAISQAPMITLDSTKLKSDIAAWNGGVQARIDLFTHRSKAIVLKRQAGLLARTLINISLPKNKKKTSDRLSGRVNSKFEVMRSDHGHAFGNEGTKEGHGDVRWYAWSKWAIYGVARDKDYSNASVDELYNLFFKRSRGGAIKGQRGKQRVYIWQRITTKKKTVDALIKRLTGHIGRLKASFIDSWRAAGSPGSQIGQWIMKHADGARGDHEYLPTGNSPSFTIISRAKGCTSEQMEIVYRAALRIRLQAMKNDALFALKDPKAWNEREARAEAAMETA